jgi:hypothetical protein
MKTPNITRSNHFLPVCYQKAFADADGKVWVQFLNKDKPPFRMNPQKVGVINRFYTRYVEGVKDDSIENFFSDDVEDLFAPIAKRVKEQASEFTLNDDDIPILLKFVASQIVRTQAHKRCIDEQAGQELSQDTFFHNMGRKMKKMFDAWLAKFPDILLHTPLPIIGNQFITGDNPVTSVTEKVNPTGIETPYDVLSIVNIDKILQDPNSAFTVPLSPYVCLTVANSGTERIFRSPQTFDSKWVSVINQRTYGQCVQFVEALHEHTLGFHVKRETPTLP